MLLLADLLCFVLSYLGGGYLWLVGYRNVSVVNMKLELMDSFSIVLLAYMLIMVFSDIESRFIRRSLYQDFGEGERGSGVYHSPDYLFAAQKRGGVQRCLFLYRRN